mgnify:CR=1 FL=1
MELNVCTQLDKSTNTCLTWLDLNTTMFAITGWEASLIITAISSYFVIMWLLKQSRYSVK